MHRRRWIGSEVGLRRGAAPPRTLMAPKAPPVRKKRTSDEKMGSSKARAGADKQLPIISTDPTKRFHTARDEAAWRVAQEWAPVRPLSERELAEARKMFFQLDTDSSGAIDADELGTMMRTLGQDPSYEECEQLIQSVDEGDHGERSLSLPPL